MYARFIGVPKESQLAVQIYVPLYQHLYLPGGAPREPQGTPGDPGDPRGTQQIMLKNVGKNCKNPQPPLHESDSDPEAQTPLA